MRLFPSVPWELISNFMRDRKGMNAWSFCVTFEVVALVVTEEITSEYWKQYKFVNEQKISLFFNNLGVAFLTH